MAYILTCAPPNDPDYQTTCEPCEYDDKVTPATVIVVTDEWMNPMCDNCHAGTHTWCGGASDCPVLTAQNKADIAHNERNDEYAN